MYKLGKIRSLSSRVWNNKLLASLAIATTILLLLLLPNILSSYVLHILIMIFLSSVMASSLNLVVGYCGQLSFAHGAFAGIGAYTGALLMLKGGLSFWIALFVSGLMAAIFGFILGLPTLRVKEQYLVLVTMGFGEIVRLIILNWTNLTNGPLGLVGVPSPSVFGYRLSGRVPFYYITLLFLLISIVIIRRLVTSGIGLSMQTVNCDEVAAKSIGIYPFKYKLMAFVLSAAFAGMVGCIYGSYIGFINPDTYVYNDSLTAFAMVILGGSGSIVGPIIGAVLLTTLPEILRAISEFRMIIYGGMMVLMMIFRPEGFWGMKFRKRNVYKKMSGGISGE